MGQHIEPENRTNLPAPTGPSEVGKVVVTPEALGTKIEANPALSQAILNSGRDQASVSRDTVALAQVVSDVESKALVPSNDNSYLQAQKERAKGNMQPLIDTMKTDLQVAIASALMQDSNTEPSLSTRLATGRTWNNMKQSAGMDEAEGDKFIYLSVVPTLSQTEQALLWRYTSYSRKLALAEFTDDNCPPDIETCSEADLAGYLVTTLYSAHGAEQTRGKRFEPTDEAKDDFVRLLATLNERYVATIDLKGREGFSPINITALLDEMYARTEEKGVYFNDMIRRMIRLAEEDSNLAFILRQHSATSSIVDRLHDTSRWDDSTDASYPFSGLRRQRDNEEE